MNILQDLKNTIMQSGLFDEDFYLHAYPAVYRSGMEPVLHYLVTGWKNGYFPSLEFDTKLYLHTYKDVHDSGMNPLLHYILYGKEEGRSSFSEEIKYKKLLAYAKISPLTIDESSIASINLNSKGENNVNFIIYAPPFDENSGGNVVLHRLCDLLNKQGESAYIWPLAPCDWDKTMTCGEFQTPIAKISDLSDKSIVVYPEITYGNPLKAKNVVRWLLYYPGFLTGRINYAEDELFFYCNDEYKYIDPKFNVDKNNRLSLGYQFLHIYKQTNFGKRKGTCYILRKGGNRKIVHNIKNSILIDGKSHQEIAEIFNDTKCCISYDLNTALTGYAIICGCLPIIIPKPGLSREEWCDFSEEQSYGVAYGFCDIDYAKRTRGKFLLYVKKQKKETENFVKNFIQKCKYFFKLADI